MSLLVVVIAGGCASYPVNPPLDKIDPESGYRFQNREMNRGNSDETFIILALSGGGTRAAAFSYGVIRELNSNKLRDSEATLLDEVDIKGGFDESELVECRGLGVGRFNYWGCRTFFCG